MKQQSGFTLIELIIVIVILGILAVTAAPKFIDIQGDATASTLQGVRAALKGGAQLVYAKAAIAGKQKTAASGTPTVKIQGQDVPINFGYPDADLMTTGNIPFWVELDFVNDWALTESTGDDNFFIITPKNGTAETTAPDPDTRCQVTYTGATDSTTAKVSAELAGC